MEKVTIRVYTNLNNFEENNEFLAIKDDNLIKYTDLENNKMTIDIKNNFIIRDNSDYLFNMDFDSNKIMINVKKLNKTIIKNIKTLVIRSASKKYLVRYLLTDENIINEYYVKF